MGHVQSCGLKIYIHVSVHRVTEVKCKVTSICLYIGDGWY